MSSLQERIVQYQKMASDDPNNELGHFRLGSLYLEAEQYENAVASFRRTLEIEPQFSRVYQLLGQALIQLGRKDEAVELLRKGFDVADERGDKLPRDEMAKMLVELGQPSRSSGRRGRPAQAATPASAAPGRRARRAGSRGSSTGRRSTTRSAGRSTSRCAPTAGASGCAISASRSSTRCGST
jgi:tetratricopeptide (TPR) repeat protein